MLITSLQTTGEANRSPPLRCPKHPRFQNYPDAWATAPCGHFFLNSALITLVVLVEQPRAVQPGRVMRLPEFVSWVGGILFVDLDGYPDGAVPGQQ